MSKWMNGKLKENLQNYFGNKFREFQCQKIGKHTIVEKENGNENEHFVLCECVYCKKEYIHSNISEVTYHLNKTIKKDMEKIKILKELSLKDEFENEKNVIAFKKKKHFNEECMFRICILDACGIYEYKCSCGYKLGIWQVHPLMRPRGTISERQDYEYFCCGTEEEMAIKSIISWHKHLGVPVNTKLQNALYEAIKKN